MDNTNKILIEMKNWLFRHKTESLTISDCFRIANELDEWRVKMFYVTFAPYMANVMDDYKCKQTMFGINLNNLGRENTIKLIDSLAHSQGLIVSYKGR